uniref:Uncharacterized protein n=1 Tax=Glossina austeni TaxID=7395 RepID=A0A1A9VCZ5_GLOAU
MHIFYQLNFKSIDNNPKASLASSSVTSSSLFNGSSSAPPSFSISSSSSLSKSSLSSSSILSSLSSLSSSSDVSTAPSICFERKAFDAFPRRTGKQPKSVGVEKESRYNISGKFQPVSSGLRIAMSQYQRSEATDFPRNSHGTQRVNLYGAV